MNRWNLLSEYWKLTKNLGITLRNLGMLYFVQSGDVSLECRNLHWNCGIIFQFFCNSVIEKYLRNYRFFVC